MRHHIQNSIIGALAYADSLRFSELKPDELDNRLFTYHLKQLMAEGLVVKTDDSKYQLSLEGRRQGTRTTKSRPAAAHSILFLAIKKDSSWLLYKRLVHPLKDKVGFMHASPLASEDIYTTAESEVLQKTGLTCSFSFVGSGYFRMVGENGVESFTHFSLLLSTDPKGELQQNHARAEYFWAEEPMFNSPDMLPNMQKLTDGLNSDQPFFIDETIRL